MKNFQSLFAVLVLLAAAKIGAAQGVAANTGGLYSTLNDFVNHKLTYPIDCNQSANKLKLNELFESSTGYVIYGGEKHAFDKSKVYGYRSCKNKNYRFYKNSAYQIIDTAGFYIYYQYMQEEKVKGKGLVKTDEYFFSTNGNGPVLLLTADNLKSAFPDNSRFHYALDAQFKSDKDLLSYDGYQKTYKIKYLYSQSLK